MARCGRCVGRVSPLHELHMANVHGPLTRMFKINGNMKANNLKEKYRIMDTKQFFRTIRRMGLEVVEKFPDLDNLIIAGIRTRGVYLARYIKEVVQEETGMDVPVGEIDISFYRDDLSLIDEIPIVKGTRLGENIDDKKILIVDDVLFTGRTVRAALEAVFDFGRPKVIKLAVLIDRGWRELPICADIIGKKITTTLTEVVKVKVREVDGADEVWMLERID